MNNIFSKILSPLFIGVLGICILAIGGTSGQSGRFMFGGGALLIAAVIIALLNFGIINKKNAIYGSSALALVLIIVLSLMNVNTVNEDIQFAKEKSHRYSHVIQRLKDIRQAEMAYKKEYGVYTGSFDTLTAFLKFDSISVVKITGAIKDGLTEQQSIDSGYYSKDTTRVAAAVNVFDSKYLETRSVGMSLNLDSLRFVPFEGDNVFNLEAGEIRRNSVTVQVFECYDSKPFDPKDVMTVGSMTSPSTSGNWKEEK